MKWCPTINWSKGTPVCCGLGNSRTFSYLPNIWTYSGAHSTSWSVATWCTFLVGGLNMSGLHVAHLSVLSSLCQLAYPTVIKRRGTWWHSWLRHCATSQKVAGSVCDGVTGIFHWHYPSGCTMALGSTQPLTEMSTRNISWGVKAASA